MKRFAAPWSRSLWVLSGISTVICLAASGVVAGLETDQATVGAVVPLAILAIAALCVVRGYRVGRGELVIHRLLWSTRIPLAGLVEATFRPDAMRDSLRLFGNGGLYSFTGLYRNRELGNYRAFVNDPARTVVLRVGGRTVVVSPDDPAAFVRELNPVRTPAGHGL